jgi:hypothetical protein
VIGQSLSQLAEIRLCERHRVDGRRGLGVVIATGVLWWEAALQNHPRDPRPHRGRGELRQLADRQFPGVPRISRAPRVTIACEVRRLCHFKKASASSVRPAAASLVT